LRQDATDVIISALAEARSTHRIWLLEYPMKSMSLPLYDALDRHLQPVASNDKLGILCFEPL
ncbi:MAG: hypothetical protein AB1649_27875, partial [Chloroflexota bacterium]